VPNAPTLVDPDETWHMPERMYLACRPDGSHAGVSLELRAWSG
jgi:hypothetical protein